MALENARKFLDLVREDQALQDRLAGMTPEDRSNAARELGLDFTKEELTEALKTVEVSLDELEQASGGGALHRAPRGNYDPCSKSPNEKHNWVKQGHDEEPHTFLFWDYTVGYDILVCSYCGAVKWAFT